MRIPRYAAYNRDNPYEVVTAYYSLSTLRNRITSRFNPGTVLYVYENRKEYKGKHIIGSAKRGVSTTYFVNKVL